MQQFLLFSSLLIFLSFLLIPLTKKLGAPILLFVLIVGMLVGEDGPGQVQFDDFSTALALGSVALAVILFAGGLETDIKSLRGSTRSSVLLATLGVIITAALVGFFATWILEMPPEHAFLLGAIVASTDAAATFLLIRQSEIGLDPRLENTLVLESGINDPMAIFLTVALTAIVNTGESISLATLGEHGPLLVLQVGVGGAAGYVGGRGIAFLLNRIDLPEGLSPAMAISGGLSIFAATDLLGGSGFLAAYLAGLILRSHLKRPIDRILNFSEALQWLSQMALFLMLGLLVTPNALIESLPVALAIAGVLVFIARPVAVVCCISWLGFTVKEQVFVSWVGLRGAVPIFLAILPVVTPGPISVELFNIVFVIVVASLVFQGWTIAASARLLGLSSRGAQSV